MRRIEPREGAVRVVKRFLLFPKSLPWCNTGDPQNVMRWLEKAQIRQEYRMVYGSYGMQYLSWEDVSWADMVWATVEELEKQTGWEE